MTFEHVIYGEGQSLGTALWAMPLRSIPFLFLVS